MRQVGMQIGAERRLGTATFESVDPYTGEPWAVVPEATRATLAALKASVAWPSINCTSKRPESP